MELRPWRLELWALLGCFTSLAGIVVLLAVFDGKSIFEWNGVTLNTIISILAVSMKAFLLFSVAECVGQWKWIVFSHTKRRLYDFELIDMASRGPLGALSLLWRKETPAMLRLGVIMIILTVALDPFSQQLVKLEQGVKFVNEYHGALATSPRTEDYTLGEVDVANVTNSTENPGGRLVETMSARLDLGMEAAILNGLARSTETVQQQAGLRCPSGNCTWPVFDTLGVCYHCNDLTADLRRVDDFGDFLNVGFDEDRYFAENVTAYTLPNGHLIANLNECFAESSSLSYGCSWGSPLIGHMTSPGTKMTSFSTGNPNKTNSMQNIDTLIWSTSVIHIDDAEIWKRSKEFDEHSDTLSTDSHERIEQQPWRYWPGSPIRAEECALYYCVKSVNSSVLGNIIHEDVKERKDAIRDPTSWQTVIDPTEEFFAPENIPKDNDTLYSLEFHDKYAAITMEDLAFYFPDNSSQPQYRVTQHAVKAISAYFQQLLLVDGYNSNKEIRDVANKLLGMKDAVVYNGISFNFQLVPDSIGGIWSGPESDVMETFKRLAISMTNDMRANGGTRSMLDFGGRFTLDSPSEPIEGHIGLPVTVYRSEWYWIALHAVLTIGGCVFCLFTVIYSSREANYVPPWKTSALPVLSNGHAAARALGGAETLGDMGKRARDEVVTIRLLEKEAAGLRQSVSEDSDENE